MTYIFITIKREFDDLADDGPLSTARKDIVEEPIVIFVPHTREQVIDLTRQAVNILFEQNASFEHRENIRAHLPNSYFQQGRLMSYLTFMKKKLCANSNRI